MSIYVDDSDEFENDSLDGFEVKDSFDENDYLDEVPESPPELQKATSNIPEAIESILTPLAKSLEKKSFSTTNSTVKELPTVMLKKDENASEKILDYRNVVNEQMSSKTSNNFGSMKFKDFKEAKKAKQSKTKENTLMNDHKPPDPKKAKIETSKPKVDCTKPVIKTSFVADRMIEVKRRIKKMSKDVSNLERRVKPCLPLQFIKSRKSILPSCSEAIVDETIADQNAGNFNDDHSNREEIPDSLENSEVEILDSDIERHKSKSLPSTSKMQFIKSRPTLIRKNKSVYANETIDMIEEEASSKSEPVNVLHATSFVNETFHHPASSSPDYNSSNSISDLSVDSLSGVESLKKSNMKNELSNEPGDGELKMTLFKKKKNTNIAAQYNHNVAQNNNRVDDPKMLYSPVRKKNERKQLNGFMCKQCQDYYANRDLPEEQLKRLIQECSRHRDRHSPYRSPNHFWETDFPESQEKIKTNVPKKLSKSPIKKAKSKNTGHKSSRQLTLEISPISKTKPVDKLEKYNDFVDDIDYNSRPSNVLHSTKFI